MNHGYSKDAGNCIVTVMIMIMMTRFGLGSDRWNIARCWFSCFIGYLYSILYVFVEYIDRVRILVNDYRMFFFLREEKIKFKMDFWKARNLPFHIFLFITNEKSHSCRFNRRNTFEKISRFRSTNSIQFTKICLNIADYDYTSSILSSFSSTFRCIKRYPSRIEKQINRKKREEEEERFGWGVCAQWRGDGGALVHRDIFQWAVAAIFSKRRYVPNHHRKVPSVLSKTIGRIIVYRDAGRSWPDDRPIRGSNLDIPVLLGRTKGSIVRGATAIAVDNVKEEMTTVGYIRRKRRGGLKYGAWTY